ncbi:DinB family protein [Cytobacillus firmus]|uniref:DinB family protein n=1 Tax=Cytobacillus firmus TaxID=1399 RepID=UPI0018CFB8F4|nr:DinB family protein [Cytobacillus firmus]MBG9587257.1 hypothetical protein [Cytobacillus firmus]
MNSIELFMIDYLESRRRFLIVANAFPDNYLTWRPDEGALSIGETIRHVLLHDLSWLNILKNGSLPSDEVREPLWLKPYISVADEINTTLPYHYEFIDYVNTLQPENLSSTIISWPHKQIKRTLGDTLERKSYHDAIHTGQLLQYMRMIPIERPNIWD